MTEKRLLWLTRLTPKTKKRLLWLTAALVVAYVLFCLTVYWRPQLFFYNPSARRSVLPATAEYPAQEVFYKAEDGTPLYAWYTKPQRGRPVIVFLHGNSHNIETFYHKLLPLIKAGYGTFLPEYRGFGGIDGLITQPNLEMDTRAALKKLRRLGYSNARIVLYGMSLGSYTSTYAAAELGAKQPFAGLILEVPFDSLLNVVRKRVWVPLPLSLIVRDIYDNRENIAKINTPLLVMGAGEDRVVPVELAQNLFALAENPKDLIVYEHGSHSNLFDAANYEDILVWLANNEKTRQ